MSTLLNKSYLVKVSTKEGGGVKCPKFCLRSLYIAPYHSGFALFKYQKLFFVLFLIAQEIKFAWISFNFTCRTLHVAVLFGSEN